MRSSGGAHTSDNNAAVPFKDDNRQVSGSQKHTAAAPDLKQPATPQEEVTPQAPPETRVTASPAAPTRRIAQAENHSDAKQVASPSAGTPAAPTGIGAAGLQVRASASKAAGQLNIATATAGETDELDRPTSCRQVHHTARSGVACAGARVGPKHLRQRGGRSDRCRPRAGSDSPAGVASVVDRTGVGAPTVHRTTRQHVHFSTPVADLVQTTTHWCNQIEPLGIAQAALIEAPTTTSIFFGTIPSIGEANGTVMVPIVRTGDLTRPSTIEYGITPDTATAGVDYVGGNGTITMDVGVDRVFIPVQILNDNLSEPTETFVVSIINVDSGSTLLFPRTARIDILDDENPVVDPISPPLTSNYDVTQQVAVSGLNQPLAFEFAPQDPSLVYVAEKGGVIKVFNVNTGAQQSTFIDISSKVNDNQDRGLLDIVLDPNFGTP